MNHFDLRETSLFHKLFEESSDYIALIVVDKDNKPSFIYLNSAARKALGILKKDDLLKLTLQDIYPPWSLDIIKRKAFSRIYETGVWRGKVAMKNREGQEIPISQKITAHKDTDGTIQFYSSIARNIAEFRKEEQEKKLYQMAFSEYISDAVIITDKNFIIKSWNKASEDLYGWKRSKVVNKLASEIVPSTLLRGNKEEVLKQLTTKGRWRGEVIQKNHDGKTVTISTSLSAVKDAQGNIVRYIAVNRDISRMKEEEKRRDDFINTATHELRTPLTSFTIYMQLLKQQMETKKDKKIVDFIEKMDQQLRKYSALIEELLDATKLNQGKLLPHKQDFFVDELLKEIVDEIQPTLSCSLHIRGNKHIPVTADRNRLQQVVTNLIANAVKFSLKHANIILQYKENGENLEISVQDFGIGIAKEHHKKIFDQFYQIQEHTTYPGLGLGLYISSEIIKAHKGKMWVESTPGKGSTFYFTLPLAKNS